MRYGIPTYDRNTAKGSGYGESTSIYTIKNGKVVTVLNHSNVIPARHDNFVHIFKIEAVLIWDFLMDTMIIRFANIPMENCIQIAIQFG